MSDSPVVSKREQFGAVRYALLAGTARGLQLLQRVPEYLRLRGWPTGDPDLRSVLCAAIACKAIGAGGTRFRRPPGADDCGGSWPREEESRTASRIIERMGLDVFLEPR